VGVSCGGLAVKAHRLLYHSTLGLRVIKKKKFSAAREYPPSIGRQIKGFKHVLYLWESLGLGVSGASGFMVWVQGL